MFKALSLFRLAGPFDPGADLTAFAFAPCGPTEPMRLGFVPPRGEDGGPLVESLAGEHLLRVRVQQRMLPGSVVRRRVDELADKLAEETGRKPGAKRRRELKDEAVLELLPQAFTRERDVLAWVSPAGGLLAIGNTSGPVVDAILSLLTKALAGFIVIPWATQESPAACMAAWLRDGDMPEGFGLGRDTLLQSPDSTSAAVRFARHALDTQAVAIHLAEGKTVRELALNWRDRLDFVLDGAARLKRIELDTKAEPTEPGADLFDADFMLATSTLGGAIVDLAEALGGMVATNG